MPSSHRRGAALVAVAFLFSTALATLPTPLYAEYRRLENFSSLTVTLVFAAFAVGVLLALAIAGHLSDTHGRRPLLVAAALAEVASAALFSATSDLSGVLVARLLCGVGIGLLVPTATATLAELLATHPRGAHRSASLAVVANLGGLAAGPLIGVALMAAFGAPLRDPYLVLLAVLVPATLALALVPETRPAQRPRPAYRPARLAAPVGSAATFWSLAAASGAAFSVLGSYAALAPRLVTDLFDVTSPWIANLPVTLLFGCAALGQLATASWPTVRRLVAAGVLLCGGLGLVAATAVLGSLAGALVAAAIAGTGVGLAFRSAVAGAAELATPATRGAVTSALLLVTYSGLTLPVVAVGVLADRASATTTLVVLSAVVGVVVATTTTVAARVLARRAGARGSGHDGGHTGDRERGRQLQEVARPSEA